MNKSDYQQAQDNSLLGLSIYEAFLEHDVEKLKMLHSTYSAEELNAAVMAGFATAMRFLSHAAQQEYSDLIPLMRNTVVLQSDVDKIDWLDK